MHFLKQRQLRRLLANQYESRELRELFRKRYGIDVGMYSYGCFDQNRFDRNTQFGRYCSIATTAVRFGRNHPVDKLTMHPYFYNKRLGVVGEDLVEYGKCLIEDDVWLGGYSVILPKVSQIGRGAVVAAGAIVSKNVAPYSIVAGNPAKVIGQRFSDESVQWVEASQWWKKDISELQQWLHEHPDFPLNPLKSSACQTH